MRYRKTGESERVYQAIKERALVYRFGPGEPIRIAPLAAQLGVSTTPIRAALNMLAAEGLVTRDPHKGFFAMPLSTDRFAGLYSINQHLLCAAIATPEADDDVLAAVSSTIANTAAELAAGERKSPDALAGYTGVLFSCLAQVSGNGPLVRYIERNNEWLHLFRTLEAEQLDDVPGELLAICELFLAERREEVVEAIEKYHARRLALLPNLLAELRR